jgi:hypothetical protein
MTLISDALTVWDEICNRGLEPGKEERDEALLHDLKERLDLGEGQIREEIIEKHVEVEELVYALFSISEPFAKMYAEIYNIMQRFNALRAKESILVKFDFSFPGGKLDFDLSKFKERYEILTKLRELGYFWTYNDLGKLFKLYTIIDLPFIAGPLYRRNIQFELPEVPNFRGDLHDILVKVRHAVQSTIENVDYWTGIDPSDPLHNFYSLLTDLVPGLQSILMQDPKTLANVPSDRGKKAKEYFFNEVWNKLQVRETKKLVKELIDALNLPFWKYRWYLYEVWATMQTIDALSESEVLLKLDSGGALSVDRGKTTEIATIKTNRGPLRLVAQLQTPLAGLHGRKAVQPDLRICEDPIEDPNSTRLVVELKQRQRMTSDYLSEIVTAYEQGCPNSLRNFVLNYDSLSPKLKMLATTRTSIVGDLNPSHEDLVKEYKDDVLAQFIRAGYLAYKRFDVIMFDISSSMQGRYEEANVQHLIKEVLIKNRRSRVFLFNTRLIEPASNDPDRLVEELKRNEGGTELEPCLMRLLELGDARRILLVTDSGYGTAPSLSKFQVTQCQPTYDEIAKIIGGK